MTQAQYTAAQQACRSKLPAGGFGGRGGGFGGLNSAAAAAYRNCLEINGVTIPSRPTSGATTSTTAGSTASTTATTTSTSGSTPARGYAGLNPSNPTVAKALAACANLRPGRSAATTTTSTTS